MERQKESRNDIIISALKDFLTGQEVVISERENYPINGRKMFRTLNIPESTVELLESACKGQRIKSKIVEIAVWRKIKKEIPNDK